MPDACRDGLLLVPVNVAPWLMGLARPLPEADAGGAEREVFVAGPWDGGFSSGIDDVAALRQLPRGYARGIWTNRIDRIAPLVSGPR